MSGPQEIEQLPFGEGTVRIWEKDDFIEAIAAACHMQNRVYCLEALGDDSQPLWTLALDWMKASVIEGVKTALVDPDPAASHQRWFDYKRAEGWTYGEVKDPAAKTHPCMVPFGDLPGEQQRKDELFVQTVLELGQVLGLIRIKNGEKT